MSKKLKVILSLIALATAFAFGRYTSPEKVREVTKSESKEKSNSEKDKSKDVHEKKKTKTVVIKNPDGSTKTIKVVDSSKDTNSSSKETSNSEKLSKSETEKETTYSRNKLTLLGLAAQDINNFTPKPIYGGMVSKEVLGPITAGAFGFANGMVGLGLGLSF